MTNTNKAQMSVKQKLIQIPFVKTRDDAIPPTYAHDGDAGLDMYTPDEFILAPGENVLVDTGIAFGLCEGLELQARAKSGLALKRMVSLSNGIGTVDPNFRNGVGFIMENKGQVAVRFKRGDKVGQVVPNEVPKLQLVEVDTLDDTNRGTGGYGSTGYSKSE